MGKISKMFKGIEQEPVKQIPMHFDVYGSPSNPSLVLMHGMLMDGSMMKPLVDRLKDRYYLIVPTMHGSMGEKETTFRSIDGEAACIEDYVIENLNGHLDGFYGISMGATVAWSVLEHDRIRVDKAVLDGLYVAHQGLWCAYFTSTMMYEMHHQIALGNRNYKIPFMMKYCGVMMGYGQEKMRRMLEDNFTANDVTFGNMRRVGYYEYTYRVNPDAAVNDTEVRMWCGSKEPYAKKSDRIAMSHIRHCREEVFQGYSHGDLMSVHPDQCAECIRRFMEGREYHS